MNIPPPVMPSSTMALTVDLRRVGAYSAASAKMFGTAAPIPTPATNRQAESAASDGTK